MQHVHCAGCCGQVKRYGIGDPFGKGERCIGWDDCPGLSLPPEVERVVEAARAWMKAEAILCATNQNTPPEELTVACRNLDNAEDALRDALAALDKETS